MAAKKSGSTGPKGIEELPGWLVREGAMWRPLEQKGVLIKPARTPRSTAQLFTACERVLVEHLKSVCTWPAGQRNQTWRVGDYSFYVVSFAVGSKVERFVQFWSEPQDDSVLFEVSSGATPQSPTRVKLSEAQQEALRDRGFEVGGGAGNFGKSVRVANSRAVGALARETIAVLCEGLGYDGTVPLKYKINLESRADVGYVYSSLSAEAMAALLTEWRLAAKQERTQADAPLLHTRVGNVPIVILFVSGSEDVPDEYRCLLLRTYAALDKRQAPQVAIEINQRMIGIRASVDDEGDLMLESEIFLHGGVTAEHLKQRLELFAEIVAGM